MQVFEDDRYWSGLPEIYPWGNIDDPIWRHLGDGIAKHIAKRRDLVEGRDSRVSFSTAERLMHDAYIRGLQYALREIAVVAPAAWQREKVG